MKLPVDWDVPARDNEMLCAMFEKSSYKGREITLPYRLFKPVKKTGRVPLVVFLHGADAVGTDNVQPLMIHDIGTMFAKQGWQERHPCFILAPQYAPSMHWSTPPVGQVLVDLIHDMVLANRQIDNSRIYIYGYSAGGVGTLRMLKEHPGYFAAGISICGATSKKGLDFLTRVPLWMIHAVDDEIVKATYRDKMTGELYHYGSKDIYEFGFREAEDWHYTELPVGYMKEHYGVNPHCSWVVMSDEKNEQIGEWLFSR